MADEKTQRDGEVGPFQIGRRYEEVEAGLGRLHEARDVKTGQAALLLLPGDRVEWQPNGPWQIRLFCHPALPYVALQVEQAPDAALVTEMADVFVMMTGALQRVEDSPWAQAHVARGPVPPRTLPRPHTWLPGALAGLAVLLVGLSLWSLVVDRAGGPGRVSPADVLAVRPSRTSAPELISNDDAQVQALAYPLPYEPFMDQAKAPCRLDLAEVEINGGCWVALEQRPPCAVNRAEHQGKCYLPVAKERRRKPQSVDP